VADADFFRSNYPLFSLLKKPRKFLLTNFTIFVKVIFAYQKLPKTSMGSLTLKGKLKIYPKLLYFIDIITFLSLTLLFKKINHSFAAS